MMGQRLFLISFLQYLAKYRIAIRFANLDKIREL